ncbi:polysaccharide lyase 6 family protein [Flammeovirga sp. SubArs3]|uniref:polysaccharide lyase 6 family protein n=1 Tax=Flammeovirga sp. SubArs3 TaxID=2995316 RepID=UPI00248D3238|nr:polysaccharide lyase 6 family protein [Flammeovirga sp. SubArs3]
MKNIYFIWIKNIIALSFVVYSSKSLGQVIVSDAATLEEQIASATAGDTILMKNGIWKDLEVKFTGEGTVEKPIILKAQTNGKVIIEGQSYIGISGKYLVVEGLTFKNGYTPTNAVISYRTSSKDFAYHCRVTQCLIENFSNPERYEADKWVEMYGKDNRFDHNALIDKRNKGVTFTVRLNNEESRENNHIIEYNYFGKRQNLGSNGGETLRIGTSHYSRTNSNSIVRKNYFESCDGELEIISNKSCGNTYQDNVFDACKGTLTMRHGERTLVENNYFLGKRKHNTGGIRVINERQTVNNNYISGLTGYRFRGALVVMNGVPNSPLNRYNQVDGAVISNNLILNSDHVQLCAGSDVERSATPINSTMSDNIFMTNTNPSLFTVYDDISGIQFEGNFVNKEENVPVENGFKSIDYQLTKNSNGLLSPSKKLLKKIGFKGDVALPVSREEVGPAFYDKDTKVIGLNEGKEIHVQPGINTIIEALKMANPGDILLLEGNKEYVLTKTAYIHFPVTLKGEGKATILSEKSVAFQLENEADLELNHLVIDAKNAPDQSGNCIVSTSRYSMNDNYIFKTLDCEIRNLNINHTFNFLKIYPSTMADTVLIENSQFGQVTGSILALDKEVDDLGMYNAEYVIIQQSSFKNIDNTIADVYRGGTDESTFGPNVEVLDCTFENVGHSKRNKEQSSLTFHGVQKLEIDECHWIKSAPLKLFLTNGEPISEIKNCTFQETDKVVANSDKYSFENIKMINK